MRRTLALLAGAVVLLALIWMTGYLWPSQAAYAVESDAEGQTSLVLRVARPGLFVDVISPEGAAISGVQVAGSPAGSFAPWPGAGGRQRVLALWRGPVTFRLAEGPGPFRLEGLPEPVGRGLGQPELPDGWQVIGGVAGRFDLVDAGPVRVAMPAGLPDRAAALDRVRKLYEAAAVLMQAPPQREATVALTGPEPEAAALAVLKLWLPEPTGDLAWWPQGAAGFYTMRLLDQTGLWGRADEARWLKAHQHDRGFALVQWLDAALRYTNRKDSAGEMLRTAMTATSTADVIAAVRAVGGLTTADTLDRMLRGREPLPIVQSTPG